MQNTLQRTQHACIISVVQLIAKSYKDPCSILEDTGLDTVSKLENERKNATPVVNENSYTLLHTLCMQLPLTR